MLDAARRCWASLWTDRAVVYRATNGIDHRTVRLAVVVQRMVDAVTAGVLFTANPVTGRRREAVVDASPGLGEAVVSGAVDPDHFVVDTASGEVALTVVGLLPARVLPGNEEVLQKLQQLDSMTFRAHLEEVLGGFKRAVLLPEGNYLVCCDRPDAGKRDQLFGGGSINVDASRRRLRTA